MKIFDEFYDDDDDDDDDDNDDDDLLDMVGSFYVKSPNPPHLTPMNFVEVLSDECIHQEMKTLKFLSLYPVRFRNYDHLKYEPFSLDTKPLKFLAF